MGKELIRITVPGKPIAKKRPRFARRGKFVMTYNDQETEEGRFLWDVKRQFTGETVKEAIGVYLKFFMPIPKSASKKQIVMMIGGDVAHTKKPDIDNLIKFTLDCLNGVVFEDDSQIVDLHLTKRVSKQMPGIFVIVENAIDEKLVELPY